MTSDDSAVAMLRKASDFTYVSYLSLMKFLRKRYNIVPFRDYPFMSDRKLVLRHDVDGSMVAALRMAELENQLVIKSTFMVGFSMKFYNLFEEASLGILRRISEMGHEIGLHYDARQYASYGAPSEEVLRHELNALEMLTGKRVNVIARHNVSLGGDDPFMGSRAPMNAYNREFCEDALFVSDSCRAWYLRDLQRLLTEAPRHVQLLIHPMLWSDIRCTRYELLDNFFTEQEKLNAEYKEYWKACWRKLARVHSFDTELIRTLSQDA
jgi:hypothetical protein